MTISQRILALEGVDAALRESAAAWAAKHLDGLPVKELFEWLHPKLGVVVLNWGSGYYRAAIEIDTRTVEWFARPERSRIRWPIADPVPARVLGFLIDNFPQPVRGAGDVLHMTRPDYLLRFWGRDAEQVAALCPVPVDREQRGERGSGAYLARFEDADARARFRADIPGNLMVVTAERDGEMSHYRTVACCLLRLAFAEHRIEVDFGYGYPDHSARFMLEEGNYACDCNRAGFIREKQPDFPEMDCGDEIKLVELTLEHRP